MILFEVLVYLYTFHKAYLCTSISLWSMHSSDVFGSRGEKHRLQIRFRFQLYFVIDTSAKSHNFLSYLICKIEPIPTLLGNKIMHIHVRYLRKNKLCPWKKFCYDVLTWWKFWFKHLSFLNIKINIIYKCHKYACERSENRKVHQLHKWSCRVFEHATDRWSTKFSEVLTFSQC